ncbi:MAG TPA: two-component regulator propeller domain-containing protein, partial [Geobacteraceae bacterium]
MRWARPFTSSLLICLLALRAPAQDAGEVRFRTLSIDDGLSQSTVRAILRDHRGFMWFATQDGLDRYDGYAFMIFRHNDRDSLSLADNLVTCLLEDSRGTLWVGTYNGGVDCYDGRRGGFRHFPGRQTGSGPVSVTCLAEDRSGRVWVGTWGAGLMAFDPANRSWRYLRHDTTDPSSLIHDQVKAVAVGRDGRLWVATWGGLDICDPAFGRFVHLSHGTSAASLSDNRVASLVVDKQGIVWAGTFEHGLNRIDPRDNSVVRVVSTMPAPPWPQDRMLGPIAQDGQGVLWIATRGAGILRFDPRSGIALPLRHDDRDRTSLSANAVTSVYIDSSGGSWVGTDGGGVNHFDSHRFKFGHLR